MYKPCIQPHLDLFPPTGHEISTAAVLWLIEKTRVMYNCVYEEGIGLNTSDYSRQLYE